MKVTSSSGICWLYIKMVVIHYYLERNKVLNFYIDPLQPGVAFLYFLYPLETSENLKVF